MANETDYCRLLLRSLAALAIGLAAVVVCYYLVDRPVAFFVYHHQFADFKIFKWLTFPPPTLQTFSPLLLALVMVRRAWGPLSRCEHTLFVASLSLIVADEFRTSLGDMCGRYWPETWRDNNPSLIGTGTYGFHPFRAGDDVGSFPSGHAARILGFASVWWISLSRTRSLLLIVCPPMLLSLVAMDYHFVSDVIAGSFVGAIVGVYAICLSGLAVAATPPVAGPPPNADGA